METESRWLRTKGKIGEWWLGGAGFLSEMMNLFWSFLTWCLHNSVNMLKATQLYILDKRYATWIISEKAILKIRAVTDRRLHHAGSSAGFVLLLWGGHYGEVLNRRVKWSGLHLKRPSLLLSGELAGGGQVWKQGDDKEPLVIIQVRGAGGFQEVLEAGELNLDTLWCQYRRCW